MKILNPFICDYCGIQKKDVNAWWLRLPDIDLPNLDSRGFCLIRWDNSTADQAGVEHICGQECAGRAMAKWMSSDGQMGKEEKTK
jgi:hypothetical protein